MSGEVEPTIASINLLGFSAERGQFDITLEIDAPYLFGPDEWICSWRVVPLRQPSSGVHGGDAFQALCLAIKMAKTELAEFVSGGGRLQYVEGDDFDLGPFNANEIIWNSEG